MRELTRQRLSLSNTTFKDKSEGVSLSSSGTVVDINSPPAKNNVEFIRSLSDRRQCRGEGACIRDILHMASTSGSLRYYCGAKRQTPARGTRVSQNGIVKDGLEERNPLLTLLIGGDTSSTGGDTSSTRGPRCKDWCPAAKFFKMPSLQLSSLQLSDKYAVAFRCEFRTKNGAKNGSELKMGPGGPCDGRAVSS